MTTTMNASRISVRAIHTEADLLRAQRRVESLWGAVSGTRDGDELEILTDLVDAYERRHHPIPDTAGVGALRALMDGNGLTQSDLPEIGNQSTVSQVLLGKRQFNLRQIRALAARFKVPPGVFI